MADPVSDKPKGTPNPHKLGLAALIGAFLALCVAYSVTLPIFEAPDEASHFVYADYLARNRRLPDLRIENLPSHEVTQPLLYYALVAVVIAPFDRSNLDQLTLLNPDWFDRSLNLGYQGVRGQHLHNPALERFPYFGAALAVHVARLVSALLGAMVVLLVYLTAQALIAPQHPRAQALPLLAAALVAFNPKFIHVSSIVNNDIAITLTATAAVWWMVRLCKGDASVGQTWTLGMGIGAAVLSKLQGLGLLVPSAFVLAWTNGEQRWRHLAALVGGALLISGGWLLFNMLNYGHPLALQQIQAANQALVRDPPLGALEILATIPLWFTSYWGNIGIELHYDEWVNGVFFVALIAAVAGCALAFARRLPMIANRRGLAVMLIWQATLILMFVWWLRSYVGTENSRLILPGVAGVAILTAMGWLTLLPARWLVTPVVGLAALAVAVPWVTMLPAYTPPPTLSRDAIIARYDLPRGERYTTFGGVIELLHAAVERERAQPGGVFNVALYWGALQPINQSYRVVLELVDPFTGMPITAKRYIPYHGRFATQRWTPGAYFRDEYRLPVPAESLAGVFLLQLKLFALYPEPGGDVPIDGADARAFLIRRVKITAPKNNPPLPDGITTFGDAIRLVRLERVGDRLRFEWAVLRQPNADYTLFVHVLGVNGEQIAQQDAQPFNGEYPTSLWDAGERVTEERDVLLPLGAARLRLGWYDSRTGQRLPVQFADGTTSPEGILVVDLPR